MNDLIENFPSAIRGDLHNMLKNGVLTAAAVKRSTEVLGLDIDQLMLCLIPLAANLARAPISAYQVGAVARGMSYDHQSMPNLYLGANMEFARQSLCYSLHAEQSALANAWHRGESGLHSIAVSAPPCGYCRQFLHEVANPDALRVLFPDPNNSAAYIRTEISQLLPSAFGPRDMGFGCTLMSTQHCPHPLQLGYYCKDDLVLLALDAARHCYAPYTMNFGGCALQLTDGRLFSGRYGENAAHNPGLLPLNAALSNMMLSAPTVSSITIARAVLVEHATQSSHRDATQNVLYSVAPNITLEYHPANVHITLNKKSKVSH
ncbi:MAG: cytidine deaminase [Gammaproteobacteria bacterium]|nr:cytidine deaminase [Gammaproteobacteria bacterium]